MADYSENEWIIEGKNAVDFINVFIIGSKIKKDDNNFIAVDDLEFNREEFGLIDKNDNESNYFDTRATITDIIIELEGCVLRFDYPYGYPEGLPKFLMESCKQRGWDVDINATCYHTEGIGY